MTSDPGWDGDSYQARFDELAASGASMHGEADFVEALGPASVLDAGCGSGRVAIELARRGIDVVGADRSASMLATAARLAPSLRWVEADIAGDAFDLGRQFDVVVMAGNVPLFTPEGTRPGLVAGCARHVRAGGVLVAGFQLGRAFDVTPYALAAYDRHCTDAGLQLMERFATWDRAPFGSDSDYAVSIHRR